MMQSWYFDELKARIDLALENLAYKLQQRRLTLPYRQTVARSTLQKVVRYLREILG